APMPTGLDDYIVFRGAPPEDRPTSFTQPFLVWRRLAAARGFTVVGSLGAVAPPAGPSVRGVWEAFRDEILADLRRAMPVNAVLLNLHGAMVADGYDDCEGDILARVRQIVGPSVPVGAELDPHCHVTPLMVEQATVLVLYKEFPHTDFAERAEDLFGLVVDAAEQRTRPRMDLWDCRMIGSYFTTLQPMKAFVDDVKAREGKNGVLSISPVHGFPYADVPGNGTKMLVVTDDQPAEGARLARELGLRWIGLRGRTPAADAHRCPGGRAGPPRAGAAGRRRGCRRQSRGRLPGRQHGGPPRARRPRRDRVRLRDDLGSDRGFIRAGSRSGRPSP